MTKYSGYYRKIFKVRCRIPAFSDPGAPTVATDAGGMSSW